MFIGRIASVSVGRATPDPTAELPSAGTTYRPRFHKAGRLRRISLACRLCIQPVEPTLLATVS